jgi:hypothetical protein
VDSRSTKWTCASDQANNSRRSLFCSIKLSLREIGSWSGKRQTNTIHGININKTKRKTNKKKLLSLFSLGAGTSYHCHFPIFYNFLFMAVGGGTLNFQHTARVAEVDLSRVVPGVVWHIKSGDQGGWGGRRKL